MKLALVLSLVAAAPASAQTLSIVVREGDTVPGVGTITRIDGVEVSSTGTFVEVDTDANTDVDSVLLRDSTVVLREGQALASPAGAALGGFDGVTIDPSGTPVLNLFLDGTSSSQDDSGVFFGDTLVIQEGDVSTAPQFSAGTTYIGFFDVQSNVAGNFLVMASLDDPNIASTVDRAIVVVTVDSAGNLVGEDVLIKEGDIPNGQTEAVADFETGAEEYAINRLGQTMWTVDLEGDTAVDRAVYLGQTLLMQEGSPSPVAGRNWGTLSSVEVDLNDSGSWVAKANLDSTDTSTDQVIVSDGSILVQEGDSFPAIAPFRIEDFGGSVGVFVLPNGDVLWFGDWDDPDTSRDEGLFLNDQLILQEGVTSIGGDTIVDLTDFTESLHVSEDGQLAIMEGEINASGTDLDVAILIELGSSNSYCAANANATGLPAVLQASGSQSVAANSFTLGMSQLPPLTFAFFLASQTQGFVAFPAGSAGNLCLGGDIGRYVGPGQIQQSNLAGSVSLAIDLTQTPQPLGFVSVQPGEQWNFQGWLRDSGPAGPTSNFTDGVAVVFAP